MKEAGHKKIKRSGLIATAVNSVTDKLYSAVKRSVVGRFLRSADYLKNKTSQSLILNFFAGVNSYVKDKLKKQPKKVVGTEELGSSVAIYNEDTIRRTFKKRFRSAVESSIVLNGFHRIVIALLSLPVMSLGIYMLAFGMAVTAVQAYELFAADPTANGIVVLGEGLLILLLSLPALLNRDESIYDCFGSSLFGNFIMFSVMGAEKVRPRLTSTDKHYGFVMFMLGVLSGALTLRYSITVILVGLVIAVCALRAVYMPEFGVVCIIGALPFYSFLDDPCLAMSVSVLYVFLCYVAKATVGKRSFFFGFVDFFVLMFGLTAFITSVGRGQGSLEGVLVLLIFIIGYFAVRNIIVSAKWVERCLVAFVASSYVVSVVAIIQWLAERIGVSFVTVYDDVSLASYVGVAFLVTLSRAFTADRYKNSTVMVLLVQIAAMLVSGSRIAAVILVISVIGFMLVKTRKTVSFLLLTLFLIPVAYCVFSAGNMDQLLTLISFKAPSQEAKITVWRVSCEIIEDYLFHGIGMSDEYFASLFSHYCDLPMLYAENSRSLLLHMLVQTGLIGSCLFAVINVVQGVVSFSAYCKPESDKRFSVCAIGITFALIYMMLYGVLEYVWADKSIILLFWLLLGLSASCSTLANRSANKEYDYLEETSTDVSIVFE